MKREEERLVAELYDLLGLSKQASVDEIRSAIVDRRRTWRRRTSSAQIEIRQEAERRMQELDEAERTLLDDQQRREYDNFLDFAVSADEPATQDPDDVDDKWVVKALEQIDRGQFGVAMFTAQRAVQEDPENSYAWSILAESAAKAGDLAVATDAIERALRLEPEDARLHLQRGAVLEESGDVDRALNAYRTAVSLDPNRPEFRTQVIEHLARHGDADEAIREAESVYRAHPDDGSVRDALARTLLSRAELAQHELPDGSLVISDHDQAKFVESLANRGLSVEAPGEEVNSELRTQRDYARRSLRRAASLAAFKRNYKWPLGLGLFAMAGVCCTFTTKDDAATRTSVFLLAFGLIAGFAAATVLSCTQPRYVRNAQRLAHAVTRRPAIGRDGKEIKPAGSDEPRQPADLSPRAR